MEAQRISPVDPRPSEILTVESAGDEDPAVEPSSSDDQDQPPPAVDSSPEVDLQAKIIKQMEYYFSDENLPNDKFLMKHVKKDKQGFVSISLIASFRKMKKLTKDSSLLEAALKKFSQLIVSSDGKKVKRLHPLLVNMTKDPKSCTVVVENLPEDHSVESIKKIFDQIGRINSVSIHDQSAAEDAVQSNMTGKLIGGKIYALIEYETVETAEKAVATLNDERDWRNGLRVRFLRKRMGYNMGQKAWKAFDTGKNSHTRLPVSAGNEDSTQSNEQHGDAPKDEVEEQISKERNGRKGRHQKGRKYCSTNNGMGHGSSSVLDACKPPPGPRMPDGTRGFTMGRGRPIASGDV